MCRLNNTCVETIRIDRGRAENLCRHERRMNLTLRRLYGMDARSADSISASLADRLPLSPDMDNMKCRVVYDSKGICEVTISPYVMRPVHSLRLVCSDDIEYTYKSTDREAINRLFARRGEQDDIIIVKNNLLTDTSIANIALYDGNRWYTPRQPLLCGTRRSLLTDHGMLHEADISPQMLPCFRSIMLFNAMIAWGAQQLPLTAVKNVK